MVKEKGKKDLGRSVSEEKKRYVTLLQDRFTKNKSVLIASSKGLPSSQFQEIKKRLRRKAEFVVAKKTLVLRALRGVQKGALQNLKNYIQADTVLIFSDIDVFELSAMLAESQSPTKAKVGDIAPEDIVIEPGPTDLLPGPAISELSSIGLKVAVEGGKLSIKKGATVTRRGEPIQEKVVTVLGKLNILPMKVGFIPSAGYDSLNDVVYENIKVDRKAALEELQQVIRKALGLAVHISYTTKETISFLLGKAQREERAIKRLIGKNVEGGKV